MQSQCSQPGHCKKRKERYSWSQLIPTTLSHRLKPKSRKLFNLSKEDNVHQCAVRKLLNKEGKKPQTKAPKIQHFVTPCVLQHKHWHIVLRKQHRKRDKKEVTEYASSVVKRIKEDNERHLELTAKRHRLCSERFYLNV